MEDAFYTNEILSQNYDDLGENIEPVCCKLSHPRNIVLFELDICPNLCMHENLARSEAEPRHSAHIDLHPWNHRLRLT